MKTKKKSAKRRSARVKVDIAGIFAQGTPIDEALAQAAQDAIRRHREAGVKVPVFRNGKIMRISPELLEKETR